MGNSDQLRCSRLRRQFRIGVQPSNRKQRQDDSDSRHPSDCHGPLRSCIVSLHSYTPAAPTSTDHLLPLDRGELSGRNNAPSGIRMIPSSCATECVRGRWLVRTVRPFARFNLRPTRSPDPRSLRFTPPRKLGATRVSHPAQGEPAVPVGRGIEGSTGFVSVRTAAAAVHPPFCQSVTSLCPILLP